MTKLKTIPQVRSELLEVARAMQSWDLDAGYASGDATSVSRKIKRLTKSLHRRPYVRRAKSEHEVITPKLLKSIKAYAKANPNASYATIGYVFNVAIGRVSEAVAGKRAA